MTFQWLQMRISEENDRRRREKSTLERLPKALEEVRTNVENCVTAYCDAFGRDTARVTGDNKVFRVSTADQRVEVTLDPLIPGFQVHRAGADPLIVEVGLLPGEKLYFRDKTRDQYVTMEELTRRVLDRIFFPKLAE